MTWKNQPAVAHPYKFAGKSSPRVLGMTPSFLLRLEPVRGSSEATKQMMVSMLGKNPQSMVTRPPGMSRGRVVTTHVTPP